jgi:hypothetical protein
METKWLEPYAPCKGKTYDKLLRALVATQGAKRGALAITATMWHPTHTCMALAWHPTRTCTALAWHPTRTCTALAWDLHGNPTAFAADFYGIMFF